MKPLNVVQVPRRFVQSDWGGTETVILETSKRLLAMGHQTRILCSAALAACREEVIHGVPVQRVPYFYPYLGLSTRARRLMDRKGGNLFSFALMRHLRRMPGLDLIHLHTAKRMGGIARWVSRRRGIPYIVSLHGGVFDVPSEEADTWTAPTRGAFEWGRALGWWVGSRRVLQDAAAIVCVGEREREETQRRLPGKRVVHLPNGVDAGRFAKGDGARFRGRFGLAPRTPVVLTVSRIDPQKNQRLAVDVLSMLGRPAHLVLIGHVTNDAYHRRLGTVIHDLGLADRVTLVPGLDADGQDLVDAYDAADVFLLPSVHEPFGIVILEAWAAGLPVVASRVGGVVALVADGEDGLLFESGDVAGCAGAVRSVLRDRGSGQRLGEAGRRKARKQYGWDTITARLVALYEDVVRENPVRQ